MGRVAPSAGAASGRGEKDRLPAAGVGAPAVVRLAAAGAQLATLLLRHDGSVPGAPPRAAIAASARRWITLESGRWSSPPVLVATTVAARWSGLRRAGAGRGVMFIGAGAVGAWLRAPVKLIGLDASGRVVGRAWLEPWSVTRVGAADWVLELPAAHPWPAHGAALSPRPMLAPCPAP